MSGSGSRLTGVSTMFIVASPRESATAAALAPWNFCRHFRQGGATSSLQCTTADAPGSSLQGIRGVVGSFSLQGKAVASLQGKPVAALGSSWQGCWGRWWLTGGGGGGSALQGTAAGAGSFFLQGTTVASLQGTTVAAHGSSVRCIWGWWC